MRAVESHSLKYQWYSLWSMMAWETLGKITGVIPGWCVHNLEQLSVEKVRRVELKSASNLRLSAGSFKYSSSEISSSPGPSLSEELGRGV